jgi:hypothetical protein
MCSVIGSVSVIDIVIARTSRFLASEPPSGPDIDF